MARIGELIGPNGEVIQPKTSAEVVYLEDGRTVEQVLSDDVDYGNMVFQDNTYHFGNDVEDDFAKTVIIKGQTYQNILPEPSTPILSNNKKMFKVNEGLDANVEIVDGVSKSAILKGQTLVNILTEPITNRTFTTGVANTQNTTQLQANKKYIAFIDIANVTNEATGIYIRIHNTRQNGGSVVLPIKDEKFTIGLHKLIFTMPSSSYSEFEIMMGFVRNAEATVTYNYAMVLEYQDGMENWDIPYFEGMQSVKMPVLTTTGKNLLNDSTSVSGWISDTGVIIVRGELGVGDNYLSDYIYTGDIQHIKSNTGVWVWKFDENKNFISLYSTGTVDIDVSDCAYIRIGRSCGANVAVNLIGTMQLEFGTQSTSYEPYKTNILHTPEEVVLRSLPNGVKDTLNLNTGEYVQRIGEVILDGSDDEQWRVDTHLPNNYKYLIPLINVYYVQGRIITTVVSNKFPSINNGDDGGGGQDVESVCINGWAQGNLNLSISKTKLSNGTINELREYLSQNPITVQYQLATESVKTVDLSSSGNWEKVVLDGSNSNTIMFYKEDSNTIGFRIANLFFKNWYTMNAFSNELKRLSTITLDAEGFSHGDASADVYIRINKDKLTSLDANGFKQYLQQNPITLYYQTQTHQDSTQVKQPIFFKDGHIIQSSGADNSLIPTLDYQAKTSNSYVMDLMKPNTKYTIKASTASGKYTLDGIEYHLVGNGTIVTESNTDKFLVITQGSATDLMFLEGDLKNKTIPYFKGIKSAFEDEDKIEVLSTGKNLVDNAIFGNKDDSGYYSRNNEKFAITLKPNTTYICSYKARSEDVINDLVWTIRIDNTRGELVGGRIVSSHDENIEFTFTTNSNANYLLSISPHNGDNTGRHYFKDFILAEQGGTSLYEPYKSNICKIPLLSPLRSLPNGVCDEIILDRESNKAKIIQRVGVISVDGSENWSNFQITTPTDYILWADNQIQCGNDRYFNNICNTFPVNSTYDRSKENCYVAYGNQLIFTPFTGRFQNTGEFKRWLSQNPTTVLYELKTPIITEVDLEGFPYIYKDGHIFLNGEIAPTAGIEYSLNQGQRIAGQVETLQRHEKQFSKLEQYFADLVYSDYNYALLRFSEKLHQQEGDA